ncbi:hypothetical protein [Streptomyces sp. NPDC051546]|uniref:hypothetical protein n=1 Tax=Streptomyces sp. NPDC051546 TaxID=3365655 RepID=UPI00379F87EF
MDQDPAAYFLQAVRTALRMDTGVLEANSLHGAVTQVWFDQYEARDTVRYWHRLVFADTSVLEDEALSPRRTERATWWPAVESAAQNFLRTQPLSGAPVVVHTGTDGAPAQVAFASRNDWPDVTLRRLRSEGPVIDRLTQLLHEVESLQRAIPEGSSFDLGEVTDSLRCAIDVGEPAMRGPLPDRPALHQLMARMRQARRRRRAGWTSLLPGSVWRTCCRAVLPSATRTSPLSG